ncbi:conserved Plasmodium protein, unknown function [Plasmodium gallinaceum]|uniref:Uncharacterized protein n=1 Tax=Plasmodium gallinaceum TaxID=5849 RepID=A0A1J1GXF1_PLAGA|nr:conserved Plasmodium protein, unknown function [Plasmodium gallinaceum]CRG97132.1 conserved Plasmodium protein, unknown function [Plasmodium gallinaceum]
MENSVKRSRESFINLLEKGYSSRQKENEIKLFENIKTDISVIISEQLKKRSKTEFELTTIEKKFIYLKNIYDELEKLLKRQSIELKNEEELISNYFDYTTTNLDYIFIKYESVINDLLKTNNDMKSKLKNIKEQELIEFQNSYESIKEKTNNLKNIKDNIISIKNTILILDKEKGNIIKEIEIKNKEKIAIEKNYQDLLIKIDEFRKEFESIKEKCNYQMNEKKKSSSNLNIIEDKIKDVNNIIQNLMSDNKKIISELNNLEENNRSILINLLECNTDLNEKCDYLYEELNTLENEISDMQIKKELLEKNYKNLEVKLKDITEICEEKKKEDEIATKFVKSKSDELIKNKNKMKEKEKEYSCLNDKYNFIQMENSQLQESYCSIEKKLQKIHSDINDYISIIQMQKEKFIEMGEIKEKNEKKKIEILSDIERSEKLLQEEKNFFFKISKFLNLINLSNEECIRIKNERNNEKEDTYKQNYEELNESFNNICNEVKEKNNISKHIKSEIDNYTKNIQKYEIEISSLNEEKKKIEESSKNLIEVKDKNLKEIENRKENSEKKIKETEEMLKQRYEELKETLACQFKNKHIEHNNFLKQGEKEKLECNFQLFKSEIISSLEKAKEEKKKQIIEKDKELKIYQQRYNSLKAM